MSTDASAQLEAIEVIGRSGALWAEAAATTTPGSPGWALVHRQAYRLGLLQRLIALSLDGVRTQAAADGADHDGARFILAEMAIALTTARELVFQAYGDDPLDAALAAVAARDALASGLALAATVVTPQQWTEFATLRYAAELDLREDPAGAIDLETVAAAVLGGRDLASSQR